MSDLLNFDDDDDALFKPQEHKMDKSFDDIFGDIAEDGSSANTLDDILTPNIQDDIFNTPTSSPKKVSRKRSLKKSTPKKTVEKKTVEDLFGDVLPEEPDPFSMNSANGYTDSSSQKTATADERLDSLIANSGPEKKVADDDGLDSLMAKTGPKDKGDDDDLFDSLIGKPGPEEKGANDDLFDSLMAKPGPVEENGDDDDLFDSLMMKPEPEKQTPATGMPNDLDDLFGPAVSQSEHQNVSDDIDDLFSSAVSQSDSKNKSDDLDDLFGPPVSQSDAKKGSTKISHDSVNQSDTRKESTDSLDDLLDAQPLGTVPSCDDLLSLIETETNSAASSSNIQIKHVAKTKEFPKASYRDPVDDLFGGQETTNVEPEQDLFEPDSPRPRSPKTLEPEAEETNVAEDTDSESEDYRTGVVEDSPDSVDEGLAERENLVEEREDTELPREVTTKKTNLKKGKMERSFEDLLTGLSDESEPELDDMIIPGAMDSSNLESILGSPDKPLRSYHKDVFASPDRQLDDPFSMDVVSNTPNVITPPAVRIDTPDDEDQDFELEVQENGADDDDDDLDDVLRRNKRSKSDSTGEDFDLADVQDGNHLDVDVSKHKSALGKSGSMALRRKPSRKSRKSLLSTGDDAIFQDSTEPRQSVMNGDDDEDDLSPPPKKPSPAGMIPLPGMMGRPPSQRLSSSNTDDGDVAMDNQEVKRLSRPPPGAFILPPVGPGSKPHKSPTDRSPPKPFTESKPSVFEKPTLKKVKPNEGQRSRSPEMEDTGFVSPALRSTGRTDLDRRERSESNERNMTYQQPSLRSTPKAEMKSEEKMDTSAGVFTKPALKSTPKPDPRPRDSELEDKLDIKQLRSTPNRNTVETNAHSVEHSFDKPKLRKTGRKFSAGGDSVDGEKSSSISNDGAKTFEKPALRTPSRDNRTDSSSVSSEHAYVFEKPALKSTGAKPFSSGAKSEHYSPGLFEKPALKKTTPSPEKEIREVTEPKGMFERPALRKMDSKDREKTPDKPDWLQQAADKQSKVLDVLHTKENHNTNADKSVPVWLEKPGLRKTRAQPLQDSSNNQSSHDDNENEDDNQSKPTRARNQSIGNENDPQKPRSGSTNQPERKNNYTPSWMRQGRSSSITSPGGVVSPSNSIPPVNSEIPQWKRELAQRRLNKKEKSPEETSPVKPTESAEPEWKKGIALRKTRQTATPSKDTQSVEPEWKKAAEEKRARLRKFSSPPPGKNLQSL